MITYGYGKKQLIAKSFNLMSGKKGAEFRLHCLLVIILQLYLHHVSTLTSWSIHCPGKSEYLHLGCPALQENSGAFIHGGTGGKNIIHQQDSFIFYLFGLVQPESIPDVPPPFSAVQPCLGKGPVLPLQDTGSNSLFVLWEKSPAKHQGLVETPAA
jgi:hypothetical protein